MCKLITICLCLLLIHLITQPTFGLECYCNVCDDGQETCRTSSDPESQCFSNYELVVGNENNNTFYIEHTYGCISAGDGLLAHLQCHTNSLKSDVVRNISCCRNQNFCNAYLPQPDLTTDPRWRLESPNDPLDGPNGSSKNQAHLLIIVAIVTCVIVSVLLIAIICMPKRSSKLSSKDSTGSTCSLKTYIDKFQHNHHMTTGSSSASTHSYSISEDLTQKVSAQNTSSIHEVSYMTQEFTSGIGGRILTERSMARAVGFGQTDNVGNGRFGRVFRGEYRGDDVAIKTFRNIDMGIWKREEEIHRYLNHENIVRFIASESVEQRHSSGIWMFLEYCPYGSLCDYLDSNEILGQNQAIKILYSIINGINYLHEDYIMGTKLYKPSIAHRDIKSKNILMKSPESCCIADFGHALVKFENGALDYGKFRYLQVGTIRYMAPEILQVMDTINYRDFSTFAHADLYQFGLVLWEVCHRTALDVLHPAGAHMLPYDGVVVGSPEMSEMIKIVCEDQYRPPRYEKWERYQYMKKLSNLMVECWRPNPKARMETLGVKKKLKELYDEVVPAVPRLPQSPPMVTVEVPNYES